MEIPLLLVVVGLHLAYYAHPSLHVIPLVGAGSPVNQILGALILGYCWADVGLRSKPVLLNRTKTALLVLLVMLIAVAPLAITMYGRATSAPHLLAHDGLIQTEEAMTALLRGENPYSISYRNTPMALWPFHVDGLDENPALEHLVYLPATFLAPWPLFVLFETLTGWYDQRFFHLLIFLVSWIAASRLLSPTRWRSLTLILALSPLMLPYFIEGRNDILILGWLIITTLAFRNGRIALGAVTLSVACATKPTAWPIVPLFAVYLLGRCQSKIKLRNAALIFALVWLAFIIPFLVWDTGAFVEDAVLYQAGRGDQPYPITGYSLGRLLLSQNDRKLNLSVPILDLSAWSGPARPWFHAGAGLSRASAWKSVDRVWTPIWNHGVRWTFLKRQPRWIHRLGPGYRVPIDAGRALNVTRGTFLTAEAGFPDRSVLALCPPSDMMSSTQRDHKRPGCYWHPVLIIRQAEPSQAT